MSNDKAPAERQTGGLVNNEGRQMANDTSYLPTKKVLQRYGISAMSLWRWEHDSAMPFPAPLIINRRKFYDLAKVEAWERDRAAAGTRTPVLKSAAA